jgi:hypothetical protein
VTLEYARIVSALVVSSCTSIHLVVTETIDWMSRVVFALAWYMAMSWVPLCTSRDHLFHIVKYREAFKLDLY